MNRSNLMRRRLAALDEEVERELRADLRECADYETMFAGEGWERLDALLADREELVVKMLESGAKAMDEVLGARARLQLIRELRGLPAKMTEQRRRATEALHPEGEDS